MDKKTNKKAYICPAVLSHHVIQFETVISSLPPTDPIDEGDGDGDPSEGPISDRPTKEGPEEISLPVEEKVINDEQPEHSIAIENNLPAQDDPDVFAAGRKSPHPEDPLQDTDQPSDGNLHFQAINGQDMAELVPNDHLLVTNLDIEATEATNSPYNPPNTGSAWYFWGLEGVIVLSLSGLALWLRKREEQKK